MHLKTCILLFKKCVEIHVDKKMRGNMCNVV